MCPHRACTIAMRSSPKYGTVFSRKSGVGMKSASKMAMNSPFATFMAGFERARLVAGAIGTMDIGDVDAAGGIAHHGALRHNARLVGGVVQDLDFEQFPRDT